MFSDIIPTKIGSTEERQVEALEIFGNVLRRADNPRALGRYLCREMGRISGADHGVFMICSDASAEHKPLPLEEWTEKDVRVSDRPELIELAVLTRTLKEPSLIRNRRLGSPIERAAHRLGAGQILALPLGIGEGRNGLLLLLGVANDPLLDQVLDGMKLPSALIGMVLGNALHFEKQESALARRTDELASTEHLFEALARLSPIGIFRCDLDGEVTYMNDRLRKLVRHEREDLRGKRWMDLVHSEDHDRVVEAWRRISRDFEPVALENRLVVGDGEVVWISLQAAPEMGSDGKVRGMVGMIMDITQRKRSQAELERSEEQYRSIFTTAAHLITSVDEKGVLVEVNSRAKEILGYESAELVSRNMSSIIHPDYQSKFQRALAEILRAGHLYDQEFKMARADGRIIDVMINSSALRDETGRYYRTICIIEDVTARKLTEQALSESESKFRAITENTSDITIVMDADGRYRYISPGLGKIIDQPIQNLIGKMPGQFLHPVDMPTVREYIDLARRSPGKTIHISDLRVRDMDGRWRHMSAILTGMLDVPGVNGIVVNLRDVTDRMLAEEELRKFKTITERANNGALITDLEGRILYVNRAFAEMHGYNQQEILGRHQAMFHPRRILERIHALRERARREGSVSSEEIVHARRDGDEFPTLYNATLIRDDLGKPLFISASYVDVTELKEVQRELEESRRRVSTLMGNLPGMAYRCNNDRFWTMGFVSQGCVKLTGYQADQLIGNKGISYNDVIHPSDRDMVWDKVQEAVAKGELFELEYRIITAERREKWVWEQGRGIFDENGELEAVEGFISDITERISAESEQRASEKRYRTLFSMMMDAFAVHELVYDDQGDPVDYRYLDVNPSFEAVTGIRTADAVGKLAAEVLPQQESCWTDLYAQVVETGEPIRFEIFSQDMGRHLEVFAYRVHDNKFATVFRDISERVKAQERARKLNEELEQRVAERTAELWEANTALQKTNKALRDSQAQIREAQAELIESKKMAALGGLVAGVAHEINTPVGIGVTAASHLAEKTSQFVDVYRKHEAKRSDFEEYLDVCSEATGMIQVNLNRAAELIQSFKQVAVDRSSQKRRTFNMKSFIDEVLLSLRPELKRTDHELTVECPLDMEVVGYPGALSQILTNFVMNSLLHGFDGVEAGQMRIAAERDGDDVRLLYSDNGKGMDQQTREKAFEPFFTTKRGRGGSGLGLHVVYNLATQTLGGRIACESDPGHGTRFEVVFPVSEDAEDVDV